MAPRRLGLTAAGGWAVEQLWLFWIAPIVGALLGAAIYRFIGSAEETSK